MRAAILRLAATFDRILRAHKLLTRADSTGAASRG
jgi:hypothetical protein